MEGIIFNIQKYSIHDGPGIRTLVFLKGCPLKCKWCSNPESRYPAPQIGYQKSLCVGCGKCLPTCPYGAVRDSPIFGKVVDQGLCTECTKCIEACPGGALKLIGQKRQTGGIVDEVKKDRIFYRRTGGGVTLSGGEPFFQPDFTYQLLRELKENHISTAVETTGYAPFTVIEPCLPFIDLFLYDVKLMDSGLHKKYTGAGNELILENLKKADDAGKRIWVRVPLLAGINDSTDNMDRLLGLIAGLKHVERLELLPYHTLGVGKYPRFGMEYELNEAKAPLSGTVDLLVKRAAGRVPALEVLAGESI